MCTTQRDSHGFKTLFTSPWKVNGQRLSHFVHIVFTVYGSSTSLTYEQGNGLKRSSNITAGAEAVLTCTWQQLPSTSHRKGKRNIL
uniref:Uncharacterized protein n=1 Tax=Anguilla anguilla TaxID=7936 RepID=A0A0E9P660_ANGAN